MCVCVCVCVCVCTYTYRRMPTIPDWQAPILHIIYLYPTYNI